jgi:exosome complex component RRP4
MGNRVARRVAVPGELIAEGSLKPGRGAYAEGERIYSSILGVVTQRGETVEMVPLRGRYMPSPGDTVVGLIIDLGPSHWLVDIGSAYPGPLHVNDVPWKVEYGDTKRYLDIEDAILAKVSSVDETKRVQITLKEHGLRKLTGGQIVEISPMKVPRLIGRRGSMINMIKDYTKCRIVVGQNGRIWIDGEMDDIVNTVRVVKRIEEKSQAAGLTESVRQMLQEMYGEGS